MIYRCKCGWEKRDHWNVDTDVDHVEWTPDDVKLEPTNAYGDIEFHGAGKTKRARVTKNFNGIMIIWNRLIHIAFFLRFVTAFHIKFPTERNSISLQKEYFVAYLSEVLDFAAYLSEVLDFTLLGGSTAWMLFFTLDNKKKSYKVTETFFPSFFINNGNLWKLKLIFLYTYSSS